MEQNDTNVKSAEHAEVIKGVLSLHGTLKGTITPIGQLTGKIQSVAYPIQFDLATDEDIDDLFL